MAVKTQTNSTESKTREVVIPALQRRIVEARLKGTTPLLVHRYSDEERAKMEAAQQGAAKTKKAPRDPQAEFEAAQYRLPDGRHGFPAIGVKLAMVSAGMRFAEEKGTQLKGAFSIPADLLEIESPTPPRMRSDRVVLQGMSRPSSISYRPEYWPWEMTVPLVYNANFISLDQLLNLLQLAGFAVGIGDWRVEKDGTFGQFEVVSAQEVQFTHTLDLQREGA